MSLARWSWLVGLTLVSLLVLSFIFAVRPWYMRWGATTAEAAMPLAGDRFIPSNAVVSTRAITIHAPADRVWRWMVQLGQGRGGFYSYSWLENLFAADMHNVNETLPELQQLQVGDRLALMRGGEQSPVTSTVVTVLEPERTLVLGEGWTLALVAVDAQTTRLIVRYPWVVDSPANALYYYPIFEPAHFLMESGMMLGIKARAEREWATAGPIPAVVEMAR
ncbi:MAG: hypothetical protein DCC55_32800 [Chloroflexi bacterium]|nr:MAG: hypothetical protein DCC55_32800 [Chloroflexota bacterium]